MDGNFRTGMEMKRSLVLLSSNTSPNVFVDLTDAPPLLNYEAVFRKPNFEINVQSSSGGRVNGQSLLSYEVRSGTELTLLAVPEIGWDFSRWFGIESDTPTDSFLSIVVSSSLILNC